MSPTRDQLYVLWGSRFPYELISPVHPPPALRDLRFFPLGGHQRTPLVEGILREFGVRNLFRDMVDDPRIYLVCDSVLGALYSSYVWEHYGIETTGKKVFDSDFFTVYQIKRRSSP